MLKDPTAGRSDTLGVQTAPKTSLLTIFEPFDEVRVARIVSRAFRYSRAKQSLV